jgi:DMSO reductase anchor subunit
MLVLTQLAAGAFATLAVLDALDAGVGLGLSALVSLALAGMSLGASTLHLGRPVFAWRALRGLRTSWLSREVLALSLFAGAAALYSGMLLFDVPGRAIPGLATAVLGVAGVTCSARIYIVKARPAWYSPYTLAEFFSTGLLLGPLLVRTLGVYEGPSLAIAAAAGGTAQLITQTLKFLWLSRSEQFELRGSSLLLAGHFRRAFLARLALLLAAGIVGPLVADPGAASAVVLAAALTGEFGGRWLFFVSVVPKNMAAAFSARAGAKA